MLLVVGSHISEVLQENKDLKQSIELLRLHNEEEKAALKADAFQAKEELLRYVHVKDSLMEAFCQHLRKCDVVIRLEEQLTSLKTEHHRVLVHMRTTALEHSSSKVTELTNRLRTREVRADSQVAASSRTWTDLVLLFLNIFYRQI